MKFLFITTLLVLFEASIGFGQKGKAAPDFYPLGYSGETWTGEVVDFNNELRILTLSNKNGKNSETFVAVIPDAPYQWVRDMYKNRVVDFAFDKKSKTQTYRYMGSGEFAGDILPSGAANGTEMRDNPPEANVMSEFAQFKGRKITVYYTRASRTVGGQKETYNDVWRIRILK